MQLNLRDNYLFKVQPSKILTADNKWFSKASSGQQLRKNDLEKANHNDSMQLSKLPLDKDCRLARLYRTEDRSLSNRLKTERAHTDANVHSYGWPADSHLESSQMTTSKRSNERQLSFGSLPRGVKEHSSEKMTLLELWTDRQQSAGARLLKK
jgi:hypothetical protein